MAKKNNAARRSENSNSNANQSQGDKSQDTRTDMQIASENEANTTGTTAKVVDRRYDEKGNPRFGQPYKYEGDVAKANESKVEFKVDWNKRDCLFLPGNKPKGNGQSVMSRIFELVSNHKEDGKVVPYPAKELAVALRYYDFNSDRSKYTKEGIPAVGWAEGYIDGACRKNNEYLKIVNPDAVKRTAPNAGKTSTDGDKGQGEGQQADQGGDKGEGDQGAGEQADNQSTAADSGETIVLTGGEQAIVKVTEDGVEITTAE